MIRGAIHAAIKEELISLGAPDVSFVVERPGEMSHGDYASNAALSAAKVLKRNPREVAEEIAKKLENKIDGIEKIEVAGAGFINFFISHQALLREVANTQQDSWGKNDAYANKTVMVEYTDPNPFKEFHIGHLMGNAIGESIARLLEWSGAEVIRANYQGDVGPHVAKAMFVLLEQQIENPTIAQISLAYVEGAKRYEEHSADKAAIDALNKKIYDQSDERVNALYKKGRALSLKHFEELYKILGTKFNLYFFESESGPKGLEIVKAHPEVFEHSDGATIFRGENYGLHTRVFVNSQGLPTYEAKELGLIETKLEKSAFDFSITVTANEIKDYFDVIRKVIELVFPDLTDKILVRFHGFLRLTTGKMSSRKGNVVTGESLLEDLTEEAEAKMRERKLANTDEIAQQVAVGAIKYAVLKQGAGRDIIFDPERSLSLEGDSGPYLQYAHTRSLSLLRAANKAGIEASVVDAPAEVGALERMLIHYPEVVERAAKELEPHYVTTYLTELAAAFNSWYASGRVIGGKHEQYGVLLVQAVEQTLKKGLQVLGIPVPEEM
ncbi:MAG: arginine--tRNA ligase [Patescibacteria group bacterium]|nr:arginine--tRNA ligase [Patescibacteria group bacterium]